MPETTHGGYRTGNAFDGKGYVLQDSLRVSHEETQPGVYFEKNIQSRDNSVRSMSTREWLDFCITRLAEKPEVNSRFVFFLQSLTAIICTLILVGCFAFGYSKSSLYVEMLLAVSAFSAAGAGGRYVLKKASNGKKE